MAEIRVTKIEAAQRQIDVAIRLLFANEDPVAIHTLASAAFRVLRDVAESKGSVKMHQFIKSQIIPGKEKMFWKAIGKSANFFKHAEHDAERMLEGFHEEVNDFMLFFACIYYDELGHSPSAEMNSLKIWFLTSHPELRQSSSPGPPYFMTREQQLAMGNEMLKGLCHPGEDGASRGSAS